MISIRFISIGWWRARKKLCTSKEIRVESDAKTMEATMAGHESKTLIANARFYYYLSARTEDEQIRRNGNGLRIACHTICSRWCLIVFTWTDGRVPHARRTTTGRSTRNASSEVSCHPRTRTIFISTLWMRSWRPSSSQSIWINGNRWVKRAWWTCRQRRVTNTHTRHIRRCELSAFYNSDFWRFLLQLNNDKLLYCRFTLNCRQFLLISVVSQEIYANEIAKMRKISVTRDTVPSRSVCRSVVAGTSSRF